MKRTTAPAHRVRWRQGNSWRHGHLNEDPPEGDGSVRVWDTYTGGARSLPATALQHETRGPRGGRRWDWIVPQPAPVITAVCVLRPLWRPPAGPAALFNQSALFEAVAS
jgi:hypothetical protein